jgi:hypothetical protein
MIAISTALVPLDRLRFRGARMVIPRNGPRLATPSDPRDWAFAYAVERPRIVVET